MANCPKCGKHLHIYNISQFCPKCGVNMNFYGFAENFFREAKLAELSQARMHVKIKNMKAAFIGSKLAIARLIVMILPLVSLLLGAGSFGIRIPFVNNEYDLSALGLFNLFNNGGLSYLMDMTSSSISGESCRALLTAMAAYAATAVVAVLVLLLSVLCFISYKNMQKITTVVSALGIVGAFVTRMLFGGFVKAVDAENGILYGSADAKIYIVALMFAVVFVVNLLLWIKGIPTEYGEGMIERTEIYKKVRKGEINIDDLPQPIVETEETRKIEEEIKKQVDEHEKKYSLASEEV